MVRDIVVAAAGDFMFPHVQEVHPTSDLAAKITGMLLEMPEQELLRMCQDRTYLSARVSRSLLGHFRPATLLGNMLLQDY